MAPGLKNAPDCEDVTGHEFRPQTWEGARGSMSLSSLEPATPTQWFVLYYYCTRCLLLVDQEGTPVMNSEAPIVMDPVDAWILSPGDSQ